MSTGQMIERAGALRARITSDAALRAELAADPRSVLERALGLRLPESLTDSDLRRQLGLVDRESPLSDEELESAAAGSGWDDFIDWLGSAAGAGTD